MLIYFLYRWKIRLWTSTIDPWLSLFSGSRVEPLLAKLFLAIILDNKGVDKGKNLLLGVKAALLVTELLESASSFCFAVLPLICFVLLLPYINFILAYWPFLSSRPTFVNNSLI